MEGRAFPPARPSNSMNKTYTVKDATEKATAAENDRTKQLTGRVEKLVAGIILVTGFQLLNVPSSLESPLACGKVLCFLALAILSLALFFGFRSVTARGHAGFPREDKLRETLRPGNVSDEAAEQALVHWLLKTLERNAKLNDNKTKSLFGGVRPFFGGFLLVVTSQLLAALSNT
jgi:hypothetical protein